MFGRKRGQSTIGFAVELDEDQIPYLYYLWMTRIDQLVTRNLGLLCIIPNINMNFGARAAGTSIAHLPEVILLTALKHPLFGKNP
ncbi:MAG: hypothetical protein BWX49_00037 [Bacteroidetes bacterium ADurb.Bin008]|nr:MAG: hypothetical protein BWX49_00037 [Bacteroidetes bacterium ADurb.Bin008]